MYSCGKDCLILIPFSLPQISCFTLILKYFSSDPDTCPVVGIGPLFHFPNPLRAGSVLLRLLLFPPVPLSYRVLLVLYILFWWSGIPACSQQVLCKISCVWRCIPDILMERDVLTSTYSSIILDLLDDTTLMAESEEEPKSLLMRMKEKSGKADLN